ncbi:hypothetical protein AAAK29_21080 [Mesorhizobium sp. CCNWLW179-1]|uniref:hypothetical protein n=1 Tax=unclassified Mesorhizobium TaxID=325217 RepID=UPI003014C1BA
MFLDQRMQRAQRSLCRFSGWCWPNFSNSTMAAGSGRRSRAAYPVAAPEAIYVVHPSARLVPAKTRAFVEWLTEKIIPPSIKRLPFSAQ